MIFIKLEQMCSENRASINLYKASKSYVFRSLRATFFVFIDYSMHYAAFEVVIY
jgi:hypothetical protein